jgi:hypothetical protein
MPEQLYPPSQGTKNWASEKGKEEGKKLVEEQRRWKVSPVRQQFGRKFWEGIHNVMRRKIQF